MEIKSKQKRQKLSLASPLKKLQSALWDQKKQNNIIEKENIILNTKINAIQNNPTQKNPHHESIGPKQRLQQLYQEIKQQQLWIKQTTALIGEKKYETEVTKKCFIQKKLKKTSKMCVSLNKKLKILKKRVQKQEQSFKEGPFFLANKNDRKQQKQIRPDDVLAELQKEHQELSQILQYKQSQLNEESLKVKSLNSELIELLELKSYLKKYINRSKRNLLSTSSSAEKKLFEQTQCVTESKFSGMTPVKNLRKDNSYFKHEPKLKITTY